MLEKYKPLNSKHIQVYLRSCPKTFSKSPGFKASSPDIFEPPFFVDQAELFQELHIQNILLKLEVCNQSHSFFTYGQKGSGKTYALYGKPEKLSAGAAEDESGLVPRILKSYFEATDSKFIKMSFIEVLNEEVTDLIGIDWLSQVQPNLAILNNGFEFVVRHKREIEINNAREAFILLEKGFQRKLPNSHSLLTLTFDNKAKLCFFDICANPPNNIHKSDNPMSALKRILSHFIDNKSAHIPFRESKFTTLFKESFLNRNFGLTMIATLFKNNSTASTKLVQFASKVTKISIPVALPINEAQKLNTLRVQKEKKEEENTGNDDSDEFEIMRTIGFTSVESSSNSPSPALSGIELINLDSITSSQSSSIKLIVNSTSAVSESRGKLVKEIIENFEKKNKDYNKKSLEVLKTNSTTILDTEIDLNEQIDYFLMKAEANRIKDQYLIDGLRVDITDYFQKMFDFQKLKAEKSKKHLTTQKEILGKFKEILASVHVSQTEETKSKEEIIKYVEEIISDFKKEEEFLISDITKNIKCYTEQREFELRKTLKLLNNNKEIFSSPKIAELFETNEELLSCNKSMEEACHDGKEKIIEETQIQKLVDDLFETCDLKLSENSISKTIEKVKNAFLKEVEKRLKNVKIVDLDNLEKQLEEVNLKFSEEFIKSLKNT